MSETETQQEKAIRLINEVRADVARLQAELTALRARLAQAEAEKAVMVAAFEKAKGALFHYADEDGAIRREIQAAINLASDGARRLLAIEAAALESARLAFDESASDEAVEAAAAKLIAALSRHGNPEDPK